MKLLIVMLMFCGSAMAGENALTLLAPVDIPSLRLSNTVERFSYEMKPIPLLILPDGRCVVNGAISIKETCEIQMMLEMDKLRGRHDEFESKVSGALRKSREKNGGE